MKPVCKSAKKILNKLTEGLEVGESRRVDSAPGAFMAVSVEHLYDLKLGEIYSVTHYFEQHGDLVPDPDMTLLKDPAGNWYPLTYQDARAFRKAVSFESEAGPTVNTSLYADLARFVVHWTANIKAQQGL